MEADAVELCGARQARGAGRQGYRWGQTQDKIGFHGGEANTRKMMSVAQKR
jgi:hypothetical protein